MNNKECVLHAHIMEVVCARCDKQNHWRGRTLTAILKTADALGWKVDLDRGVAYCPAHSNVRVTLKKDGRLGAPSPKYDLGKPNPRYDNQHDDVLPFKKRQPNWKEKRAARFANAQLPCIEEGCGRPRAEYQGFGQPPKRCDVHVKRRKQA